MERESVQPNPPQLRDIGGDFGHVGGGTCTFSVGESHPPNRSGDAKAILPKESGLELAIRVVE